jgi:EAL domain-containing protein (putative c-di-GMP-specific phosphodiesterase class I)
MSAQGTRSTASRISCSSTLRGASSYLSDSVMAGRRAPLAEPFGAEAGAGCSSITASRGGSWPAWPERLRRALREQRFVLHYQPIASVQTGEVSHYEALVRMVDESDGSLIAPNNFLPIAERHGLIGEIDRLVIGRVLATLGDAQSGIGETCGAGETHLEASGVLRVAVNLSAQSASDPDTLAFIQAGLAHHDVDPTRLVLEITETAAISDIEQAKALCRGLRALGCAVALDDFGAGFGSFYYVKHLPFRYLKIDGDFIRELTDSRQDQLFVRALVQVARGMNMQTIAEFVSDESTIQLLGELGVDYAQGYAIGRPEPLRVAVAAA